MVDSRVIKNQITKATNVSSCQQAGRAASSMLLIALLVTTFLVVVVTPTSAATATDLKQIQDASTNATDSTTTTTANIKCPNDCQCTPLPNGLTDDFLHAKCSSLNGLKASSSGGGVSTSSLHTAVLQKIHSIDLSKLNLTRLPRTIEKLHHLTSIDLSQNQLTEIGHLGRTLKRLNLTSNRITSHALLKLPPNLQSLNLQHNEITDIPLELTKLTHLQALELSNNHINCSCETLEVRNWLQERHIFMEHPVVCYAPAEIKGKPWLQVKQSDICKAENPDQQAILVDDNELMLGDQPLDGSGEKEEDELGKDFLQINKKSALPTSLNDEVEGSGDLSARNMPLSVAAEEPTPVESSTAVPLDEDEDDDGSGSGAGALLIPFMVNENIIPDDFDTVDDDKPNHGDDDFDKQPFEQPAPEAGQSPDIFGNGMGIFDGQEGLPKTEAPVDEEQIVPLVHHTLDSNKNVPEKADVVTDAPVKEDDAVAEDIQQASTAGNMDDNNAIYFLMGVIVVIVVGLVLFVAIKRCKQGSGAGYDTENPRQTELLDMDKSKLGKPIQRNGNEHIPLIEDKLKPELVKSTNGANKPNYDANDAKDGTTQNQPLLNGNNVAEQEHPESNNNDNIPTINYPQNGQQPHEYHPITPRYPTPKSPRASKYATGQNDPNENNNNNPDYHPASPKTGRYSPVYSPETGRVKIKLTETPKPKTPMLVTRGKSNAGDIITTAIHLPQSNTTQQVNNTTNNNTGNNAQYY